MDGENPIAEYARAEGIQATELGKRLGVSKGSASELINGKRRVGPKIARRMEKLTGRPWHEFVSASPDDDGDMVNEGAAA